MELSQPDAADELGSSVPGGIYCLHAVDLWIIIHLGCKIIHTFQKDSPDLPTPSDAPFYCNAPTRVQQGCKDCSL